MGIRTGVEARPKSIRMFFVVDGVQHRETLRVDGVSVPPTPANIKFANRLAIEIRDKIRLGCFVLSEYFPDSPRATVQRGDTVGDQIDSWLAGLRVACSTRHGYVSAASFWHDTLGSIRLKDMVLSDVKKAIASRPGLAGKTVNNYTAVLHQALALAVADRKITVNPIAGAPSAKQTTPLVDPFTADETDRIIEEMGRRFGASIQNLVETWLFTGMRTSEIFGLTWDDVDLAGAAVVVSHARVEGFEEETTKTGVARTVRLNSRALAAVKRQRAITQVAGRHVFTDPRTSEAWSGAATFQKVFWKPALRALGIRHRRPYNCRHTYATLMLMSGLNPAFGAKQLGHSVQMFLRVYSKWTGGDADAREMAKLEGAMGAAKTAARASAGGGYTDIVSDGGMDPRNALVT